MGSPYTAYGQTLFWGALFWISYAAWIASEILIFARDRRPAAGEPADRGSRRLIALALILGLGSAFWWGQNRRLGVIEAPPTLLIVLSLALIWAGMALRGWAVRTLGRFFRTSVLVLEDHRLVDTGPYARLRNPSYTGSMTTLLGVALGIGNWISLALLLGLALAAFAWRIHVEEAALARRFGAAYAAYRERRWALIPFVW